MIDRYVLSARLRYIGGWFDVSRTAAGRWPPAELGLGLCDILISIWISMSKPIVRLVSLNGLQNDLQALPFIQSLSDFTHVNSLFAHTYHDFYVNRATFILSSLQF